MIPAIGGGEPKPIDFSWVYAIGMRIGLSLKEVKRLYYGQFHDLYESFKQQYNFETHKMVYKTVDDYKIASVDDI